MTKVSPISFDRAKLEAFCRRDGFSLAVLFGSHAGGRPHKNSDVDVALLPSRKDASPDPLEIIHQLHDIFGGRYEIDPVVLAPDTDPLLQQEIFKRGIPLYEERRDLFVDQACRAWMLFQDTERLRQYRKHYLDTFVNESPHGA